jgi:hypothetical protein
MDMLISWFDDAWRSKTEQTEYLLDTFHAREKGGGKDEDV